MKIISVYSLKGGVGKSATSVNISYLFAKRGYKTLLWDLDPQGASSFYFKVQPKIKSSKKLWNGKLSIEESIKGSDFINLDIMPSDFSYRNLDIILDDVKKSKKRLKLLLLELENQYDLIILDSPPSISLLSDNIFYASDVILTPLIPTTLSLLTHNQLIEHLKEEKLEHKLFPFFSMVDFRKVLHKEIINSNNNGFLKTTIPFCSTIEKMGIFRNPVCEFEPNSQASKSYNDFVDELLLDVISKQKILN